MQKNLLKSFLILLVATACSNAPKSPLNREVANYAVVTVKAPDLSGITDNGKYCHKRKK